MCELAMCDGISETIVVVFLHITVAVCFPGTAYHEVRVVGCNSSVQLCITEGERAAGGHSRVVHSTIGLAYHLIEIERVWIRPVFIDQSRRATCSDLIGTGYGQQVVI